MSRNVKHLFDGQEIVYDMWMHSKEGLGCVVFPVDLFARRYLTENDVSGVVWGDASLVEVGYNVIDIAQRHFELERIDLIANPTHLRGRLQHSLTWLV